MILWCQINVMIGIKQRRRKYLFILCEKYSLHVFLYIFFNFKNNFVIEMAKRPSTEKHISVVRSGKTEQKTPKTSMDGCVTMCRTVVCYSSGEFVFIFSRTKYTIFAAQNVFSVLRQF